MNSVYVSEDGVEDRARRKRTGKLSVVIPIRDEEESLPSLIASLRQQTFSPSEIVLVDGGSTDNTIALAARLTNGDARFHVLKAGIATPGRGRNTGIAATRCEWIALTDAGIRLEPTWLERLVETVERDSSLDVVYGNFEPVIDSRFTAYAALTYVQPKQQRPEGDIRAPSIASCLLRREVWQKTGGFPDLRAAEDLIFMERIRERGFKIGWAPRATVWWQLQPTLRRTFQKFVLYSRYNVWAGRWRDWQSGLARQYAVGLIFVILAAMHSYWWALALPLGFAARVARSIWQRRERRGILWAVNPVQFLGVAVVMLCIDLATFVGWAQALQQRPTAKAQTTASGETQV